MIKKHSQFFSALSPEPSFNMLGDLFAQEETYDTSGGATTGGTSFNKMKKPPMQRAATNFVGLENQGATCYLNSLIQSMYMTPELRKGMFGIDPLELGVDLLETHEQEAAEDTLKGVIEPDENNLTLLMSMGIPEHHARRALIGTKNGSLDAVFEYIEKHENDAEFNKPLASNNDNEENGKKKRKKPRFIPIELQRLFTQLQLIDQQAVSTHELTTKGFEWQNMDGQVQHDAHELNRLLIDALEKSLKRTSGETLCRQLYEGSCVNQIKCLTCLGVSERTEPYYDINLQIVDCADMCVSLRRHCAAELLSGDSAYQCDTCKVKRQALRSTVLRTIPKVLTFSCSRFRIDRSTNWTRVKVTSRSEFPLVLDMADFSEAGNTVPGAPAGSAQQPQASVYDPLYENPAVEEDYVESLRQSTNIIWLQNLLRSAEGVAKELIEQYGEAVRFDDVDDEQYEAIARHLTPHMFSAAGVEINNCGERMLYQLHAVIMHRGSAHSGHYFAYIRDNLSEGTWELPELEELLKATTSTTTQDNAAASEGIATVDGAENASKAPAEGSLAAPAQSLAATAKAFVPQSEKAASSSASAGASGSSGAKQPFLKTTPQKAYLQDKEVGMYVVDESSPLALIIKVMRSAAAALPSNTKDAHHRPTSKPGKPQQAKPLANARFKVNFIGTEVGNIVKSSWANAFKAKYGSLEAFMRAQSDLMKVFDNGEVFLLTNNIQVVSPAVYQQKSAKLTQPAAASQQSKGGNPNTRAPGKPAGVQLNLMNDVDAQLARQLQAELDLERHQDEVDSPGPSAAGATSESWETAGAKRKERKINIDGAKSTPAAAVGARPKAAKAELSPLEARVKILSAEIISHFYGNYFEFNDSSVVPIAASHLQRAFEGGDSAYLLVYRTIAVPADPKEYLAASRLRLRLRLRQDRKNETAPRTNFITPPAYFVKEVAALNDQLQKERTKYELSFSNVHLSVHFPAQFTYAAPLLMPKNNSEAAETNRAAEITTSCPLEIDSRQTVLDLKNKIAQDVQGLAGRLVTPGHIDAANADGADAVVDLSGYVVSILKQFGDGFYVMENFTDKATISDVVSAVSGSASSRFATHVLLWNGKTIDGASVLTGIQGYPKQVSVSTLLPGGAEDSVGDAVRHCKIVPVQESKLFPSLYLASTLSLLEFAHKLCSMCSIEPLRAMISVLCVTSTSNKERTYAATTLYNKGIVSGKPLVGVAPNASTTSTALSSAAGMVMTSSSALGEFENLYYMLVEDCESRGLHTTSLTEALVARKNAEWTVTVELDFKPSAPTGDNQSETTAEDAGIAHVQFEILKYCTVADLKALALKLLQLSDGSFQDSTRLRLGANKGEQVLSDEGVDLAAAGLRNGSVLYLEQGARPASDSFVLSIVLVSHNSTDAKYALDEGGERLGEVEITAQWGDTIESLRDRAGELLLQYQPGWTARCGCLTQGSGLRNHLGQELALTAATDFVEDASTVVPEVSLACPVAESNGSSTELRMVEDCGDLKERALAEFGEEFQGRRLRRTSWLKEPAELLLEHSEEMVTQRINPAPAKEAGATATGTKGTKKGPAAAPAAGSKGDSAAAPSGSTTITTLVITPLTVKECGLKSGDTLLLEEGTLPVKGQMTIQLYVWKPEGSAALASSTTEVADAAVEPPGVLEEANAIRKACLVPLGSVVVHELDQLDELQERVQTLLSLQGEYLATNLDGWTGDIPVDRFLLRELRADLLPGRSFWTSELAAPPPTPAAVPSNNKITAPTSAANTKGPGAAAAQSQKGAVNASASATAVTKEAAKEALTTAPARSVNPNTTLKKLTLRGERGLVVELLKDSQCKVRPPAGAFRVWVQELLNPGAKEGCAMVSPRWPPCQVLINGGAAPTLGHLKRAVLSALPEIATEHMSVYKYQPQSIEWHAVIAAGVGVNAGAKRRGKTESNITQGPYFIKEGDQLCAFDSRSLRLAPGMAVDADGVIRFALAEDVQLRVLRDAERAERKLKKQYKSGVSFAEGATTVPRAARKEVMLSLGSGFDFSDDES